MLSAAVADDRREQSSPAFDLRAWLTQARLEAYYNKVVEWGYDELPFLQDATRANIVKMVEHADVAMRPGHRDAFIAAWERLLRQYPRPAIEATAEQSIANATESIAAGRPTATVDDQTMLGGTSHQPPTVDGAASLDAGRVAAVAALEDGVAPMEVAGSPAVEETGGLVHPVAAVPHAVPESSTRIKYAGYPLIAGGAGSAAPRPFTAQVQMRREKNFPNKSLKKYTNLKMLATKKQTSVQGFGKIPVIRVQSLTGASVQMPQ